ncbi:HAD family hydrolase [Salinilacihabitans rarus]|uniref:HAD family hydrolase n=1 Tax=Salinilacihabitans rarus TaxID=2961596 RepID=UPI0020C8E0C6|nr:HAD family hydrolase [Salinilacihabitans rarus]
MTDDEPADERARGVDGAAATPPDGWTAVFWDVGGVILDLDSVGAAHRRFVERLVAERDLDATVDDALETWRRTVGDYFRARDGTEFRPAREGYARGVAAVAGREVPAAEWRPLFERVAAEAIEPVPGAVEAVERLAARDLHVGVVSDVDADEGRRILETFGVREAFDSITTSEEVGRTKPDPAMFETALDRAGVAPGRSLMVGDRYEHDAAGAAALGMRTATLGDEDGPAVDYRLDSPLEVLEIVDGASDA